MTDTHTDPRCPEHPDAHHERFRLLSRTYTECHADECPWAQEITDTEMHETDQPECGLIRHDGQYSTDWMSCRCGSRVHDTTTPYVGDDGTRYEGHQAWCSETRTNLGLID